MQLNKNHSSTRRGRFIGPTADSSALGALIAIRMILFKIIIAPTISEGNHAAPGAPAGDHRS